VGVVFSVRQGDFLLLSPLIEMKDVFRRGAALSGAASGNSLMGQTKRLEAGCSVRDETKWKTIDHSHSHAAFPMLTIFSNATDLSIVCSKSVFRTPVLTGVARDLARGGQPERCTASPNPVLP
jgi:hypothetical protein